MWKSAILLCALTGCVAPQLPGRRTDRPGLLAQAQAAITRDDWDDAAVLIGRFLRENPSDPWAIQARYLLGTYYLNERELDAAEREFQFVASHAGPSQLARQAEIRIGDVALASREYGQAADIFSRLLGNAQRHRDGGELTFKLGLVMQRKGRWVEADAQFERVRTKYRDSVFAMRAAEQLAVPHHFSLQVGAYRRRANAETKQKDLAERGHEASVQELKRHGRAFFCVHVGAFESREKALSFRSRMQADPDLRLSDVVP
jgi:TolA-binding protein